MYPKEKKKKDNVSEGAGHSVFKRIFCIQGKKTSNNLTFEQIAGRTEEA